MAQRFERPAGRVGLRPAAQSVNTYVAPERGQEPTRPSQTNGWQQLASSLQTFEPALRDLLVTNQQKDIEEKRAAAEERVSALSFDELKRLREAGELNLMDDPAYNSAINQFYGQRLAQWRSSDMERRIQGVSTSQDQPNVFDRENDTFDNFWTTNVQEDLKSLQGKDARRAYIEGIGANQDRLYRLSNRAKDDLAVEHSTNAAGETFLAYTDADLDNAGILSNIQGAYTELKQRFGLNEEQLNGVFLQVLSRRAEEGRYDLVSHALRNPLSKDGTALIDQVDHMGTAAKILDTARDKMVAELSSQSMDAQVTFKVQASQGQLDIGLLDKFTKENSGVLSEAEIINLKAQNEKAIISIREKLAKENQKQQEKLAAKQDQDQKINWAVGKFSEGYLNEAFLRPMEYLKENGEVGTWTPKQIVEKAVDQYIYEESPRIARANNETPEQTFNRELGVFQTNGQVNPRWKAALDSGAYAVSSATLADPSAPLPQALVSGYETYRQLQAKSPVLLKAHLSDPTARDVYETARIGQKYLGLDTSQAMYAAVEYVRNPEMEDSPVNRPRFLELKSKTDKVADLSGWDDAKNWSKVSSELNRLGKFYVSRGLSVDAALQEAESRFKENYTAINGWFTYTGDSRIQSVPQTLQAAGASPRSFEDLVEERIEKAAKKADLDTSNFSVQLQGEQITITHTVAGVAGLPAYNLEGHSFTLKSLLEDEMGRQQKERAKAIKETVQDATDAKTPTEIELFRYNDQPITLKIGKTDIGNAFTDSTWRPKDPSTGEPLEPKPFYLKEQTLEPNFDTSYLN